MSDQKGPMAKTTEIAKKAPTELVVYDYGEHAGRGLEGQTSDELQIPFLQLLQDLSPQVTGAAGAAIEDAKAGKFFNTVTQEVLGDTVSFVPALKEHVFIEWAPRAQGGGFRGRHQADSPLVASAKTAADDFGKYKAANGNDLVETFYLYGVVGAECQPVVVPFTSTKIKAFKRWNTQRHMLYLPGPNGTKVQPPLYAHSVKISTVREKNPKGSFFNLLLAPANGGVKESLIQRTDPRFQAACDLYEAVSAGKAKAAYDTVTPEDESRAY